MAKVAFENKPIEVMVRGINYVFKPVDDLMDVGVNNLVIMHFKKRGGECTHIWECQTEVDYDIQKHMENILVSDRFKQFTKDYAMIRLTSYDENSFSFTGPDKKSIHLVRMGDKYHAAKLN